jgi:hypothetical protein
MGLSIQQLKEYAQLLGKTYDKLTKEEKRAAEYALSQGNEKGEDKEIETKTKTPVDTAKTSAGFTTAGPFVDLAEAAAGFAESFSAKGIGESVDALIKGAQDLGNGMGIGRARAAEFRAMIADTVPEMTKLGFTQEKTLEIMQNIPKTLGVNTTLTKETIVEIGSAAQISGTEAGDLANKFKSVGFNLADVGDEMAKAANYAKSVGVNVKAVTGELVANLKNLNLFNFENGVQGLTKMVAQSKMLGVNMEKVLNKAEDLMNPEKAIEFSSALQRLGVQSSALLDPLSAMDMALNDPAALQNEMVKVSQQFTRLKADGSGFEILPGAKLQLREVAQSLGMNADELANMSIKSADLSMKMSQIRFPGFAASEEDKMLIANMAQMKDGRAMVTIAKEGGGTEEVAVEDLTAEQLEKLKEEQANQNKTAEDLARDQLNVLEEIAASIKGTGQGISMGVASAGAVQRMTNLTNELRRTVTSAVSEKVTTENVRGTVSPIASNLEEGVVQGITQGDFKAAFEIFSKLPDLLKQGAGGVATGGVDVLKKMVEGVNFAILDQYKDVSGVKPGESNISKTLVDFLSQGGEGLGALFGVNKGAETSQNNTVNLNATVDIKGESSNMTKDNFLTMFESVIGEISNDPAVMSKIKDGVEKVTNSSGMAK